MCKILKNILLPILYVVVASIVAVGAIVAEQCCCTAMEQEVEQPVSELLSEGEYAISTYDNVFRRICGQYGVDWRLMSAIAYGESNFRHDAVSPRGAVGLMQVMPLVAKSMGYAPEALMDAKVCTEVAARLLHENNDMLRFPKGFDKTERLNFILACYNAGYPRIADARRLARFYAEDADKWSVVATYLPLLAEPEYAEHEVVQSGAFHGSSETITYVRKVMRVYGRYKKRIAE